MTHPLNFTFLGFYLNSLLDQGKTLDLNETHEKIREEKIFSFLEEKYEKEIDLSVYKKDDLKKMTLFFKGLSEYTDEEKKMGVQSNGICLLLAYCFEGAQRKEDKIL